jgi:glycerophosphoryl diester phosphodiesterase
VDAPIAELTLAELRKLDAGSWFDPRYRGATVPTLGELLDALAGRATLLVEMKWPERFPGIEAQLVDELRRRLGPALDGADLPPVAVQSTDVERLRGFRGVLPPAVPLVLMTGVRPPLDLDEFAGLGDWISAYVPLGRELPDGYVDAVHSHGIRVLPWTVDAPEGVAVMRALGADGIITNHLPYAAPALRGEDSGLPRTPVRITTASVPEGRTVLAADAETDLAGWSIRNQLMERQWLPAATLAAGAELVLPAPGEKFLDNYGDTLTLYDPDGAVVDLHFYR